MGLVWVWYGSGMGRTSTQDFGDMSLSLKTVKQQKVVESKKGTQALTLVSSATLGGFYVGSRKDSW